MHVTPGPLRRFALSALVVALWVGACAGPGPDRAAPEATPLGPATASVQHPDGLTLSVAPADLTADFRVQLNAVAADAFLGGEDWATARAALPDYLRLASPVFEIRTQGQTPRQISLNLSLPADLAPGAALDLYAWDGGQWTFVPGHVQGSQWVTTLTDIPSSLAAFESGESIPFASTTLEAGQTLDPAVASTLNAVNPAGLRVRPDGSLEGALAGGFALGQGYAVMPVLRNFTAGEIDLSVLQTLLADDAARAAHVQNIVGFVQADGYNGVIVDYRGVDFNLSTAFARFVRELADGLHAQNKSLGVVVAAPVAFGDGFATGGYDWRRLGAAADLIEIPIGAAPQAYGNGDADRLLQWTVGEVARTKIRLLTSTLPVRQSGDTFETLGYDAALALFGAPVKVEDLPAFAPGQPIRVSLSGRVRGLDYDAAAFSPRLAVQEEGSAEATVWLTSPDTLLRRLTLAQTHRLGGASVSGLFDSAGHPGMAEAITQYKVNAAASASGGAELIWTVSGASGVMVESAAAPDQPFEYIAQAPGDYEVRAEFVDGSRVALGSVSLSVQAVATATATPQPTARASGSGSGGGTSATPAPTLPPPPPAVLPRITGDFELGGQVVNGLPVGPMQTAGMRWVKTQARGGDMSGFIGAAHGAGFKVLITVLLDHGRVADPAYWPEVAAYAAGQAAAGADAIEVWNEMNIDAEWPAGQINPATYVEMLKVVYPAIKGANPGTLVISGALAPTGAEAAFPGRVVNDDNYLRGMAGAGAADYFDCIGIHYNTGTTSPSATTGSALSGYHYSYYFWPMIDLYYSIFGGARQLCFTELGYLSGEGYGPLPGNFSWASGVTVAHQAAWLAEAASLAASSGKVRLMIVWNVDSTTWTHDPQAGYAIIRPDGSCPACSALGAVAR